MAKCISTITYLGGPSAGTDGGISLSRLSRELLSEPTSSHSTRLRWKIIILPITSFARSKRGLIVAPIQIPHRASSPAKQDSLVLVPTAS